MSFYLQSFVNKLLTDDMIEKKYAGGKELTLVYYTR